jgi:hypothetical protein
MSHHYPPRTKKQVLTLVGLSVLAVIFGCLTYRETLLAVQSWKVRQNALIEAKLIFRVLMLAILALGAAAGPIAFLISRTRLSLRR